MCGIAGFLGLRDTLSPEQGASVIRQMTDEIRRRGPDADGYWQDTEKGIFLGHRRLAIQDLSAAGAQPMVSPCGRWVMIFNGEIYDAPEIKRLLIAERDDLVFKGHSDTEILLAAFSRWGVEKTLSVIKGMFAIALWDCREKCMTLMRDHVGKKPLYCGIVAGHLVFASGLGPFHKFAAAMKQKLAINHAALASYTRFGFVPAPGSIYQDVYKLKAGHFLALKLAQANQTPDLVTLMRPFWPVADLPKQQAQEGKTLKEVLSGAVAARMVSDVPLGAFLSGGIDSSLVVALMQECAPQPVRTYTIGFEDAALDESAYAAQVASHLGTSHTAYTVTAADTLAIVPALPFIYDEPFADYSQIPTAILCQQARQDTVVALSGDGGDEIFCGYSRYFMLLSLLERAGRNPDAVNNALAFLISSFSQNFYNRAGLNGKRLHSIAGYLREPDFISAVLRTLSVNPEPEDIVLGAQEILPGPFPGGTLSPLERMMLVDTMLYLPDDMLVKVDRASMYSSLEVRSPLLDKEVIEFAWTLPIKDKIFPSRRKGKKPLYDLLCQYLPADLIERPKQGFTPPVAEWLRGPLESWAEDLLSADSLRAAGLYQARPVQRLWQEFRRGQADHQGALWAILMAQAWYYAYKDCH